MKQFKYVVTVNVGDFPLQTRKYAENMDQAIEIAKAELKNEMMEQGHDPGGLWACVDDFETNEDLTELPLRIVEIKDWDIDNFVVIEDENDINAIVQHHGG
jgi:hypothetical protein